MAGSPQRRRTTLYGRQVKKLAAMAAMSVGASEDAAASETSFKLVPLRGFLRYLVFGCSGGGGGGGTAAAEGRGKKGSRLFRWMTRVKCAAVDAAVSGRGNAVEAIDR